MPQLKGPHLRTLGIAIITALAAYALAVISAGAPLP